MPNKVVEQIKQYITQRQIITRRSSLHRVNSQGGVRVKFANLQGQNNENQNASSGQVSSEQKQNMPDSSGRTIVEQVKYNKEYSTLIKDGKDVFPSNAEYQNWKEQLDTAYENNLPLDTFSYSLDMFTALQKAETSPIYQSEVDKLTKDTDNFNEFTTLAEKTGEEYTEASFVGTSEFNKALEETGTNAGSLTLISSTQSDVNYNVEMPETNMTVINLTNGVIANPEALFDADGLVDKAQLTTVKQQENKEEMFHNLISGCSSQEEVDGVVEAFTPDVLRHSDPEANVMADKEVSSSFALKQDDALTFDRVAEDVVTDSPSEGLSNALDASAQDIETYENPEPGLELLFKRKEPMAPAPNPETLGVEIELTE